MDTIVIVEHSTFAAKRVIIDSIINRLKNESQVERSRHRSPWNFLVNLKAG